MEKCRRGYQIVLRFDAIKMPDGSKFSLRTRTNVSKERKGDIIVPHSRVFDVIYSSHHFCGTSEGGGNPWHWINVIFHMLEDCWELFARWVGAVEYKW
jgi:hypothetical protein